MIKDFIVKGRITSFPAPAVSDQEKINCGSSCFLKMANAAASTTKIVFLSNGPALDDADTVGPEKSKCYRADQD